MNPYDDLCNNPGFDHALKETCVQNIPDLVAATDEVLIEVEYSANIRRCPSTRGVYLQEHTLPLIKGLIGIGKVVVGSGSELMIAMLKGSVCSFRQDLLVVALGLSMPRRSH